MKERWKIHSQIFMFREILEQVVSATNVHAIKSSEKVALYGQVFGSGLAKYLQVDEEKQMGQELIRIGMKTSC